MIRPLDNVLYGGRCLGVGGKSYSVGLSSESARGKLGSGSSGRCSSVATARRSPVEKRVACGETVAGRGFLLMGDEGVEDAEEKARDRVDSDGIRGRFLL